MDLVTYGLLKKYVQSSLEQAGALKGLSAYEIAVKSGYTGTEEEWLASLQGESGQTPYIGDNGNWWVGNTDTHVSATPLLDYHELINKPTINGVEFDGNITLESLISPDDNFVICGGSASNATEEVEHNE